MSSVQACDAVPPKHLPTIACTTYNNVSESFSLNFSPSKPPNISYDVFVNVSYQNYLTSNSETNIEFFTLCYTSNVQKHCPCAAVEN